MKLIAQGGTYYGEFCVSDPATGAAAAYNTASGQALKNGADYVSLMPLTIGSPIDLGRYPITGTVPADCPLGSILDVSIAATCGTIAGKAVIDSVQVISADVYAAIFGESGLAITGEAAAAVAGISIPAPISVATENTVIQSD